MKKRRKNKRIAQTAAASRSAGGHLCFFRSIAYLETPYQFDANTEFLMFSDEAGMRFFLNALRRAGNAKETIDLPVTRFGTVSSAAIILPAAGSPRRPALRMTERPIVRNNIESMELVFYGNKPGYERLGARIEQFVRTKSDRPDEHVHIDHIDAASPYVVQRSVSLSVRSPFRKWTKSDMDHWHTMLSQINPERIPLDVKPREITGEEYIPLRPLGSPAARRLQYE